MTHLTPQMFGAVGDGIANDTLPLNEWLENVKETKLPGRLEGRYRYLPTAPWDLSGCNHGLVIEGARKNHDGIVLETGFNLSIIGANCFYQHFEGWCIQGKYDGPLVTIGKDDFSDAFNGCRFTLTVNNDSLSDAAEGLRLNYVLASDIFATVNCGGTGRPGQPTSPGHGAAVVMRQASFNRLMLAGGHANVGLALRDGYSFANQFEAVDFEEVNTCVEISSANASRNLFSSGQFVGTEIINATAGDGNLFDAGCNLSPYAGGSLGTNLSGVEIRKGARRTHLAAAGPALPASGVPFVNQTGEKCLVHIWAGNVSHIAVKARDGGSVGINPQVAGEGTTVMLHPEWSVALTYSATPAWRWFPA